MIEFIDTIFNPVIAWIAQIKDYLLNASVPVSRPVNISDYLGPFAYLGPYWINFISTVCALGFIYCVLFIVMASQGLYIKFKDSVKWW